jgi:glycosyltransferase involved in cell wall biosynthesis
MPGGPLVSIVIPTFNYAAYVSEAVSSALAQTWRATEVIVVDDGSTDRTLEELAIFGDRITIIRQAHRGVAAARNAGVQRGTGQYVCYVDADDLLEAHRVERQVSYFAAQPLTVGMVFTNARIYQLNDPGQPPRLAYPRPPVLTDMTRRLLDHNFIFSATAMFRREALVGLGPYDESLATGEDYDLFLRLSRQFEIAYLDEALYICREHAASQMRRTPPAEQRRMLMRALGKQFDDPSLPPRLRAVRPRALANVHREIARQYLSAGQPRSAVAELAHAATLDPMAMLQPGRLMRWLRGPFRARVGGAEAARAAPVNTPGDPAVARDLRTQHACLSRTCHSPSRRS